MGFRYYETDFLIIHDLIKSKIVFLLYLPDKSRWSKIKCGKGPGELAGHSAVRVHDNMYMFGGERVGHFLNELWQFNFGNNDFVTSNKHHNLNKFFGSDVQLAKIGQKYKPKEVWQWVRLDLMWRLPIHYLN